MPARTKPLVRVPSAPKLSRATLNDSGRLGLVADANSDDDVTVSFHGSASKSAYVDSAKPAVDIVANAVRIVTDVTRKVA